MSMPKKIIDEKLLKLEEVLQWLRISKSNWYDGVGRNVFPQPVRIGTRTVRWLESDIEHYLQKNMEARVNLLVKEALDGLWEQVIHSTLTGQQKMTSEICIPPCMSTVREIRQASAKRSGWCIASLIYRPTKSPIRIYYPRSWRPWAPAQTRKCLSTQHISFL